MSPLRSPRFLAWLLLFSICLPAAAKEPAEKGVGKAKKTASAFLRIRRDDKERPLALEVAIVRYVPADGTRRGLKVDLVGAVHVADKSYYDQLNKRFESYDVLLYELVAPEGARIPKGGGGSRSHPVGAMQGGMKSMLDLAYQLECIDYTKKNFVHADMTPEEFAQSMKNRGESFTQMLFRMMGHAIAQQSKGSGGTSDIDLLMAFFAKDRAMRLKQVIATQFEDMDATMMAFGGKSGSTLITERNKKALAVLKKQIDGGKRRIGVFYGAGHLADMEKRLFTDFRLKRSKVEWVSAWKLTK